MAAAERTVAVAGEKSAAAAAIVEPQAPPVIAGRAVLAAIAAAAAAGHHCATETGDPAAASEGDTGIRDRAAAVEFAAVRRFAWSECTKRRIGAAAKSP